MKKFILAVMVLASLVSCGKNNKVGSAVGAAPITGVTNQIILNNPAAAALISKIDNPATGFGNGYVVSGSSNQTCDSTLGGFIQYCYSSGNTSVQNSMTWNAYLATAGIIFEYSSGRTVRNNIDVTVASQQASLREILNRATSIQGDATGTVFYVTVAGGRYVIDTRYAIQMNPSGTENQTSREYFLQAH